MGLEDRAYDTDANRDYEPPIQEEIERRKKIGKQWEQTREEEKRREKTRHAELDILKKVMNNELVIYDERDMSFSKDVSEKELQTFVDDLNSRNSYQEKIELASERLLEIYYEGKNKEYPFIAESARETLLFTRRKENGKEVFPGREELWKLYNESFGTGLGRTARELLDDYRTKEGLLEAEMTTGGIGAIAGSVLFGFNAFNTDNQPFGYTFCAALVGGLLGGMIGKGLGRIAYNLYHKWYSRREAKRHGE